MNRTFNGIYFTRKLSKLLVVKKDVAGKKRQPNLDWVTKFKLKELLLLARRKKQEFSLEIRQ